MNCLSGYVTIDTTTGIFGVGSITTSNGFDGVFSGLPSQGLSGTSLRGNPPTTLKYYADYGGTVPNTEPGSVADLIIFIPSTSAIGYTGGPIYAGGEFVTLRGQFEVVDLFSSATLTPMPSSSPVPEPSTFGLLATGMIDLQE